jgi:enoyl-CoA hydratase/carnithine racemase
MAELSRQRHGDSVEVWTIQGEVRRNTLTRALVADLIAAIQSVETDRSLRCVVLTGQGTKAFCAGADLKERSGMSVAEVHVWLDDLRRMTTGIERSRLPFIAALNGSSFGGGTELALACDLRVADETAQLALTEVTLAIIPGAGGTQRLPRLVGLGRAAELILSGRRVPATEALQIGMINRVAPEGHAVAEALQLAEAIAANGPVAIAAAKAALQLGSSLPIDAGLDLERRQYERTLSTTDRLEGIAAFREKRKPVYRGE